MGRIKGAQKRGQSRYRAGKNDGYEMVTVLVDRFFLLPRLPPRDIYWVTGGRLWRRVRSFIDGPPSLRIPGDPTRASQRSFRNVFSRLFPLGSEAEFFLFSFGKSSVKKWARGKKEGKREERKEGGCVSQRRKRKLRAPVPPLFFSFLFCFVSFFPFSFFTYRYVRRIITQQPVIERVNIIDVYYKYGECKFGSPKPSRSNRQMSRRLPVHLSPVIR